jgi:hypothetical protein
MLKSLDDSQDEQQQQRSGNEPANVQKDVKSLSSSDGWAGQIGHRTHYHVGAIM